MWSKSFAPKFKEAWGKSKSSEELFFGIPRGQIFVEAQKQCFRVSTLSLPDGVLPGTTTPTEHCRRPPAAAPIPVSRPPSQRARRALSHDVLSLGSVLRQGVKRTPQNATPGPTGTRFVLGDTAEHLCSKPARVVMMRRSLPFFKGFTDEGPKPCEEGGATEYILRITCRELKTEVFTAQSFFGS